MDAAEEIPQPVRPEKRTRVDGETPQHSPEQAAAVTKVFDDDNLLREIIVRVGFPTTLVRAALVCKRWLEHASDRKFLSHFRKLHPPRLLGYYITEGSYPQGLYSPRFVLMTPEPPELATVIRRLESYKFGMHDIMECRNGSVFTRRRGRGTEWTHGVHHPLCAQKGVQFVPPLPPIQDHSRPKFSAIISKQAGSGMSYFYLSGETGEAGKSTARVYLLQDGEWCMHTSATCPPHCCYVGPKALLMENNIYVLTGSGDDILVLDLTSSSFSTIQLPQGVQYDYFNSMLSWADDASSVYFIHVEEFLLRVWLHKGDNWLLADTICLHEMLDTLGISDDTLEIENEGTANVQIDQVGDNGQFVFLRMRQCIFYLDIKCRTLSKVYESTVNDQCFDFHPFMMMWPPIFPALKDDPARKLLDGK